jgi:hypothetical protein
MTGPAGWVAPDVRRHLSLIARVAATRARMSDAGEQMRQLTEGTSVPSCKQATRFAVLVLSTGVFNCLLSALTRDLPLPKPVKRRG